MEKFGVRWLKAHRDCEGVEHGVQQGENWSRGQHLLDRAVVSQTAF